MAEGNLILGGVPGSGTTTALVAIALTAARALDPQELDIVVLDMNIVNAEFTVENGYLTPSLKLKRRAVLRDYAHEVDALYADGTTQGEGA